MIDTLAGACRAALAGGHLRHYGGFVLAGLCALAADTAVLSLLTRVGGLSPFFARPFGIAVAMLVSWSINRTVTFNAQVPPTVLELSRFAGVSLASQCVNYAVFATLLLAFPRLAPELALLMACFVSMFVSYTGFRYGVFASSGRAREGSP